MNLSVLSNLVITKVYSASTMYNEKNTKGKRKYRPCWAIVIKYEGETIYTANEKQYVSNINHIIILPKGCFYEWSCIKAGHYAVIEFQSDTACNEIFSFHIKNSEKILNMLKESEYKRALKKPMYEMESIKNVYDVILKLVGAAQKNYVPSNKLQKISPAIDYIAKNYNKEITNDVLANKTGLSTVYFRKLFTELYGISPINYVCKIRIEKAEEMLKSDYGSIGEIAQSLGYLNIYDFSRSFKKHTGVSPSRYQQNAHNELNKKE